MDIPDPGVKYAEVSENVSYFYLSLIQRTTIDKNQAVKKYHKVARLLGALCSIASE